jgi:hypothetical protein
VRASRLLGWTLAGDTASEKPTSLGQIVTGLWHESPREISVRLVMFHRTGFMNVARKHYSTFDRVKSFAQASEHYSLLTRGGRCQHRASRDRDVCQAGIE